MKNEILEIAMESVSVVASTATKQIIIAHFLYSLISYHLEVIKLVNRILICGLPKLHIGLLINT
jgi:hypothetical protein